MPSSPSSSLPSRRWRVVGGSPPSPFPPSTATEPTSGGARARASCEKLTFLQRRWKVVDRPCWPTRKSQQVLRSVQHRPGHVLAPWPIPLTGGGCLCPPGRPTFGLLRWPREQCVRCPRGIAWSLLLLRQLGCEVQLASLGAYKALGISLAEINLLLFVPAPNLVSRSTLRRGRSEYANIRTSM